MIHVGTSKSRIQLTQPAPVIFRAIDPFGVMTVREFALARILYALGLDGNSRVRLITKDGYTLRPKEDE